MSILNKLSVTVISLLFIYGIALADSQQDQFPEDNKSLQADESTEFAAYEQSSADVNTGTLILQLPGNEDEYDNWMPDEWSDIY